MIRRSPRSLPATWLGFLALALTATPAAPQSPADDAPGRFSGAIALLNTQPVGSLATGPGIGLAASGAYALDPFHILRIRGDLRAAIYDHESREVCFSQTVGCRIRLDLDTSYGLAYFGLGPEVALPLGPVALILDATAGWAIWSTSSSLSGVDEQNEEFGNTTNYDDNAFTWSAGGELRIPFTRRVALALGSHYQSSGEVSYLTEGGITENPDGSLSFTPHRSDGSMVAITLGVAFRP